MRTYRVLVADDDEAFRQTVCAVFEPFFELIEARTGREALSLAERSAVDLAVCDMYMPQLTGLDVLRHLKRENAQRPGILMTADCSTELREQASSDVHTILEKPFTRRQLLQSVADAVVQAYQDLTLERQLRAMFAS